MPGTFFISGLYSGINWQNVIEQIMEVEHKQVDLLNDQKKIYQDKLSAWQELNSKLLSVKTKAEALTGADAFNIFKVDLSASSGNAEDYVTATANADATPGTYQIVIKQLALAKVDSSTSFTSSTDALNLSGTLELKKVDATDWVDITIDTADSLTDIKNKINQYTDQTGVVASIVQYADNDYRLILTAQETGTANAFDVYNNTIAQDLGLYDASGVENTVQAAQDAIVNVYGTDATRSTNTITDLIPGVTLNLLQADPNVTININVDRDIDKIVANIKDLFDTVNNVFNYINQQSDYSEGDGNAPPLIGDSALTFLRTDLRDKLSEGVTWDSTTHYLFEIGINVNNDGTYSVDEDKLRDALTNDFDTVKNLFTTSDTGVAVRLNDFLDFITDETQHGYVQTRMEEIQSNIDNIDKRIEETERRLEMERERLYEQFNQLETYMAQMQQMQQWLGQQLAALQ